MAPPTRKQITTPPSPWRHLLLLTILTIGTSYCTPASASVVTNDDLNFSFTVPNDYVAFSVPNNSNGDIVYGFASSPPIDVPPDVMILIRRMHSTVRLGSHIDPAASDISGATVVRGKWKTFDIDVLAGHIVKTNVAYAVRIAVLPLRQETIEILVGVPIDQEDKADRELNKFLAGVDAPSTNLPPTRIFSGPLRGSRITFIFGLIASFMLMLVVVCTVAIVRHSNP